VGAGTAEEESPYLFERIFPLKVRDVPWISSRCAVFVAVPGQGWGFFGPGGAAEVALPPSRSFLSIVFGHGVAFTASPDACVLLEWGAESVSVVLLVLRRLLCVRVDTFNHRRYVVLECLCSAESGRRCSNLLNALALYCRPSPRSAPTGSARSIIHHLCSMYDEADRCRAGDGKHFRVDTQYRPPFEPIGGTVGAR